MLFFLSDNSIDYMPPKRNTNPVAVRRSARTQINAAMKAAKEAAAAALKATQAAKRAEALLARRDATPAEHRDDLMDDLMDDGASAASVFAHAMGAAAKAAKAAAADLALYERASFADERKHDSQFDKDTQRALKAAEREMAAKREHAARFHMPELMADGTERTKREGTAKATEQSHAAKIAKELAAEEHQKTDAATDALAKMMAGIKFGGKRRPAKKPKSE